MPYLSIEQVSKSFGESPSVEVLRSVSLHIDSGTFVAIEGESGSGKSTLLNILGLLDSPSEGRYAVDGRDVASLTAVELARLRNATFGFIFQSFHLLDRRPAVDSVELGMMYSAIPAARRRVRALSALQQVGLSHRAFTRANLLSGGERQRVAIARAIASDSPILIADEPTGNLDSSNSELIVEQLKALVARGKTVVMVTHSEKLAEAAGIRLTMRDGQLTSKSPVSPSAEARESVDVYRRSEGRPSTVRSLDVFRDALRSVTSRASRTIGLALAVSIAVALVVTTFGLASTSSAQVADTFNAAANREVSGSWSPSSIAGNYRPTAEQALRGAASLSGVASVALVSSHNSFEVQANRGRPSYNAASYSVAGELTSALGLRVRWAHEPKLPDLGQVLVGTSLADQLDLGPIDGQVEIAVGGTPYLVVGLIDSSTRMPELAGSLLFGPEEELPDAPLEQLFVVATPGAARQVATQLPMAVAPSQPTAVDVAAPTDPRSLRAEIEGSVTLTLVALSGVAGLAALAALTNAMVLAVLERRQEFGLRRALGARAAHLACLIVIESGAIGLIGGAIGFFCGLAAILGITLANQWTPVFDFAVAPVAIVGGLVVGMLGGVAASFRAAMIKPSDALRQ